MGRRRRNAVDMTMEELDALAADGSDYEWWAATGNCGGCGSPGCHRGRACVGAECARCPSRDTPDHQES